MEQGGGRIVGSCLAQPTQAPATLPRSDHAGMQGQFQTLASGAAAGSHLAPPCSAAVSRGVPMARATAPAMSFDAALSTLNDVSVTVADSGDFGGSTIPVIGLGLLAAIIALLAGPVEE